MKVHERFEVAVFPLLTQSEGLFDTFASLWFYRILKEPPWVISWFECILLFSGMLLKVVVGLCVFCALQGWRKAGMASKLFDRLRRTLFKEGELPSETDGHGADDFPESSELEDDTDCVSARLGGTLCFEGDGVLDSEDAGDASGPDSDSDFFGESIDNACSSTGSYQ